MGRGHGRRDWVASGCFWYKLYAGYIPVIGKNLMNDRPRTKGELLAELQELRSRCVALEEAEGQWRALLRHSPDTTLVVDSEGAVLYANYGREEAAASDEVGNNLLENVLPEHREAVRVVLEQVFRGGEPGEYEVAEKAPDDAVRWISTRLNPIKRGADVVLVILTRRDVTANRLLQEAAADSEEKLHHFAEQTADGIALIDEQGRVVQWNPAQEEITGLRAEEVLGKRLWDVRHPAGPEAHRGGLQALERIRDLIMDGMTSGDAPWLGQSIEREVELASGERRIIQARAFPVHTAQGLMVGSVSRDVTEIVQARNEGARLLSEVEKQRQLSEELARDLQAERDTLATIMEHTHAAVAFLDRDFNFVRVNSAYERGAGYSKDELIGRNHFALFPHPENETVFRQVADTGVPVRFQAKAFEFPQHPEWGVTYWDWVLVPIQGRSGDLLGLVLSLVDVTASVRAQEQLEQQAARLKGLYEVAQGILASRSPKEIAETALQRVQTLVPFVHGSVELLDERSGGTTVLAARSSLGKRMLRASRQHLAWSGCLDELRAGRTYAIDDLLAPAAATPLFEALRAEGVRSFFCLPLALKGRLFGALCLGMSSPGRLHLDQMEIAQEMAGQVAIGIEQARLNEELRRNATLLERRVRERTAALQASEARFRTMFESAHVGIVLLDAEGRLVDTNPALRQMLGYGAAQLRGKYYADLAHPDDLQPGALALCELSVNQRRVIRTELRVVRRDGQVRLVAITASPLRDRRGRSDLVLAFLEDITQRKEAEAALVQAEKMSVTARLAESLAHEMGNPLQTVMGAIGLSKDVLAESGDPTQYLHLADEQMQRAARILNQIRNLYRWPATAKEPTDLNALLDRILAMVTVGDHVEVIWEPGENLPTLLLSRDQIEQLFEQLILNAVEAMPDGGILRIRAGRTFQPTGVAVTLADSGKGIPEEAMTHLFESFYSSKHDGLGLGLYTALNIARQHGGRIDVQNVPGGGATFTVWLPA
ncbi:MAG: PAS domain S-box protein [Anaerolineae bacterium]